MKGKVTCTCGWSWNKSDSSKKDMYICHECGRDNSNNMKNGGWLDNYGEEENTNDSSVSLPEGFVGEGYNTKGRDYSPAWGGQFQEGGEIPNAQTGKKVKYVESKNDPRYKAYQDSLSDYKWSSEILNKVLKDKKSPNKKPIDVTKVVDKTPKQVLSERISRYNKLGISPSIIKQDMIETDPINKGTNKRNRAVSYKQFPYIGQDKSLGSYDLAQYKKPQQPVIVKKQEKRKPIQAIENNLQPIGIQNDFNIEVDVPQIRQQFTAPEYYDVEDIVNNGKSQTNYQWYPANGEALRELSEESGDRRTMVPRYQTGGSLPGSVGFTYARTKGIPSEGPYSKKTMPSAQNGQEMRYYQNGLDWKPKTISRDGAWLDGYEKAQTGYTTGDKVEYGTPEYTEAYNRGEVVTDKGVRSPIALDEVVIQNNYKRPRGVWEQYADKIAEENKDAGLLGAIIGTPISAITSLPQLMGMKALTGEMQRPSEAMDIQNPYGAFAVDALADPANLIGVGELTALGRAAKAESLATLGKGVNVAGQISKQGLREGVDLIHPVGRTLAQIEKEGIANGLSPQEIKKLQLEKVGITSAQREAYFPGVSEIVTEYITPYSYDNPGARIKDIPRRIIKGEKNSKNLVDVDNDFVFDFEAKNLVSKPRYDAFRMYSGMPQKNNTFRIAETVPIDHPSYSAEQLNNLEKFSLNQEKDLLSTLPSEFDLAYLKYGEPQDLVESLPRLKTELQKIQDIKNKGIDIGNDFRQTNVMGGYNRRYFDNKMEYNDIWDLDLKGTKVEKYFGKPFLSHGQLDYSFLPAEKELTKLIEKAEYYSKNINKIKKPETEYLDTKDFINHINQLKIQDITINKKQKDGGIIKDDRGQWDHPGEITEIGSNDITMEGVSYPVLGISDTGDTKIMKPGGKYKFKGKKVTEFPMAKNGLRQEQKGLQNLEDLTNFTNYNKPSDWLNKYN